MRSLATRRPRFGFVGGFVLVLALASLSCRDSNSVSGPPASTMSANVSGVWMGSFQSYDAARCGSAAASATLQQSGAVVTGYLRTAAACGVSGNFEGRVQGNTLIGSIKMAGCTGGAVSGSVGATGLALTIGDLTKPLVTGN